MCLRIALQQIQLPPNYGTAAGMAKYEQTQNRDRRKDNDSRRAEIVQILRNHGQPMDYSTLSDLTGWTLFSLRNLINTLVDEGKVLRSKSAKRAMVEYLR